MKLTMVLVGSVLAAISIGCARLRGGGGAGRPAGTRHGLAGARIVGGGGVVAAGIGLTAAAVLLGIGLGHWNDPKPVPTVAERRHEGLQG